MAATAEPPVNARLRAFHRLGRRVLAASQGEEKKRLPYGSGDELTEKLGGRPRSYLSCARTFAEMYPRGDLLEAICGLGQCEGKPLGPSHSLHDGLPPGARRRPQHNASRDPNQCKKSSRVRSPQSALFQQARPILTRAAILKNAYV